MVTHEAKDCWSKPGNEDKIPLWIKSKRRKTDTSSSTSKKIPSFTGDQLSFLIENAHFAAKKGKRTKSIKKRKITYKHHSESESDHNEEGNVIHKMTQFVDSDDVTTNSEQSENYFMTTNLFSRPRKRKKTGQLTTEVVGEIVSRQKTLTPIRCLFGTGTTSTIVLKRFALELSKYKGEKTRWRTMGVSFKTKRKAKN